MIKCIVCCDRNWSIGRDNRLLFNLHKDMDFFKKVTKGKIVFVGYNTLKSFSNGKPLKGRSTICLCSEEHSNEDCFCVHTLEEAIKLLKELAKTQDIFVIGGGAIYKAMLPYYDIIYVTKVDADRDGDTFFPNLDNNTDFKLDSTSITFEEDNLSFKFCTYRRC